VVREWSENLPDLFLESKIPFHNSEKYGQWWNLTQLINVNLSVTPVKREIPVAQAELNFHE